MGCQPDLLGQLVGALGEAGERRRLDAVACRLKQRSYTLPAPAAMVGTVNEDESGAGRAAESRLIHAGQAIRVRQTAMGNKGQACHAE